MIEALIFDLDDTLYPESEFVLSGYRAVAQFVADSDLCDFDTAYSCMAKTYAAAGKFRVFPALIDTLANESIKLTDLVEVYRQHAPSICLFPGYAELLRTLAHDYRLGMITDGLPAVQARKVKALGLEGILDKIIYTWEHGEDKEKPHPFSFSLMLNFLQVKAESALFVGDNPDKDCPGAHGAGIKCAQIQPSRTATTCSVSDAQVPPEFMLTTLLQLPQILRLLN
jgi:putative hydrolase of the HAD superfamily